VQGRPGKLWSIASRKILLRATTAGGFDLLPAEKFLFPEILVLAPGDLDESGVR
jgi:hypothetical protein